VRSRHQPMMMTATDAVRPGGHGSAIHDDDDATDAARPRRLWGRDTSR
jgi:hypothetical protein